MARVFISSTSVDLRDYRDAAIEECNRLGLVPIAMEFFEAMAQGASAGSRQKLDQADLYLGIFARRYGYIEEGEEKGVTEIEFDHATQRGMDRLCFLVDPEWPWPESLIDHGNEERLAAFKARIERSVIRALFRSTEDFQGKLRLALTEWARGAPDPARPQPPLSLKRLAPTAQNRLRYGARQTPFVGRSGEMATLQSFLEDDAPFSWIVIEGPAGSGKSRLVQEFCLARTPTWRAGFFSPTSRFDHWTSWRPEANTLIAIDYAAERVEETRTILHALAARGEQTPGHFRVRVVLVEREGAGEWMKRLIGTRSDGYALEAVRSTLSPVSVGPMGDDALRACVHGLLQEAGKRPPAGADLLDRLHAIDPLRRPIFAMLAADAWIAGRSLHEWDRERLMRDVLARERERWANLGVTLPYENLLALATMVGDLTEEALQDPPSGLELPADAEFDRQIYSIMTGADVEGEDIPALKPDLLGEFFVLEHVTGRNQRVTTARAADLLDLAWKVRGGSTRTDRFKAGLVWVAPTNLPLFLHRLALQDFADHPAAPCFLARPRAPGVDLSYWPTLAARGVAHFVERGWIDQAKELHDELCRIDHAPDAPFDTAGAVVSAGLSLLLHQARTGAPEVDELRTRLRDHAFTSSTTDHSVREAYARGAGEIILALHASAPGTLIEGLLADQRELVRLHPSEEELRLLHASSLAHMVQPDHPLEVRERWFETLRLFGQEFARDVRLYPSIARAAMLLCREYAAHDDRLADAERMNQIVRALTRLRAQQPLYRRPNIFSGEDMFAWTPVHDDLRQLRLLLAESNFELIAPLVRAGRGKDAHEIMRETFEQWWRHHRDDRAFANFWSGAIMRHADASIAAGNYGKLAEALKALQEVAKKFPDEPAILNYGSRLSLNAVKRAIERGDLAQAVRMHADFLGHLSPSAGTPGNVADLAEASLALAIAHQERGEHEEVLPLVKCAEWALRSEAFRERVVERGGEGIWTETKKWLDQVLATGDRGAP